MFQQLALKGPGLAAVAAGGVISLVGSAQQLIGGILQWRSDPSAGQHNVAAGLASFATFGLTGSLASSFRRNGNNYVTRAVNRRVETILAPAGVGVNILSSASDFFAPIQATCPTSSK